MKFTVDQIAQLIQGTVDGDGSAIITTFNKIEEGQEGSISFLANPKYESFLYQSKFVNNSPAKLKNPQIPEGAHDLEGMRYRITTTETL